MISAKFRATDVCMYALLSDQNDVNTTSVDSLLASEEEDHRALFVTPFWSYNR